MSMSPTVAPRVAVISIALSAAVFGGFGLTLLLRPDLLTLVGVEIARPAGAVELRGFYGGLHIGVAAFFLLATSRPAWYQPALMVQAMTLGGAAAGRLIGLAADGGWEPWIAGLLVAEITGSMVGTLSFILLGVSSEMRSDAGGGVP